MLSKEGGSYLVMVVLQFVNATLALFISKCSRTIENVSSSRLPIDADSTQSKGREY